MKKSKPNSFIIFNEYLLVLAKNTNFFCDILMLTKFLESWYGVNQYQVKIYDCLKSSPIKKQPDKQKLTFNYTIISR